MRYAELHCLTNFSFLEAASHPEELVDRAADLDYAALAITDMESVAGIVRAHAAAKEHGFKIIIGAQITPSDAPPLVLWATNRAGYGRLCTLITLGRRRAAKGLCQLTADDVAAHAADLIAGLLPGEAAKPERLLEYRDVFDERCYLLAELHCGVHDQQRLKQFRDWSRQTNIPLVAAGDVHYHVPARQSFARRADGDAAWNDGGGGRRSAVSQCPAASQDAWRRFAAAFADVPEAIERTVEIAERCTFSLDELRYEYPEELAPPGHDAACEYLTQLTWEGARHALSAGHSRQSASH